MSETRGMVRIKPEEVPDGLREALDATCRLLGRRSWTVGKDVWRGEGRYSVGAVVANRGDVWWWTPGEPVFTREGGV